MLTAALFAFAAADRVAGTYLLVTAWQRRKPSRRSLADRLAPFAPTPLADEVERWLREGAEDQRF